MIIGIDEVGRGAWAGPLVVGAVSLKTNVDGLNDSKLLTAKQRQDLSKIIYEKADFIGIGWASSSELDDYGLSAALTLATLRALKDIDNETEIIIDGNINFLKEYYPNSKCVIKADKTIASVSAASIIAKVARDEYMNNLSKEFPNYGFDKNVGYGTASHKNSITINGLCNEHRLSFRPMSGLLDGFA